MTQIYGLYAPYIYKIKCTECHAFLEKTSLTRDFTCPVNPAHNTDPAYFAQLEDDGLQLEQSHYYRWHRRQLINRVVASGNEMTEEELKCAAAHFCVPLEVRNLYFSFEEQLAYARMFARRALEDRQLRWNGAFVNVFNYYSLADTFKIGQDVEMLSFRYINYGIEGTSEGDAEALFDYFAGTSGTTYETTGLPYKSDITPSVSGMTNADVATIILNSLKVED